MPKLTSPFKIGDIWGGFGEAEGILTFDGATLLMEFRKADSVFGVIKSDYTKVSFPVEQIESFAFRNRFLRRTLIVRISDLQAAAQVPNAEAGEFRLRIARRHVPAADEIVAAIKSAINDRKLKEVLAESENHRAPNA
ncbi:MAG: hypothetical protein NTX50_26775 [Candidatus Sumerlaeota bacterium]|nr:hypothetical protein [Candidatus Sumerlaeota bacterium]